MVYSSSVYVRQGVYSVCVTYVRTYVCAHALGATLSSIPSQTTPDVDDSDVTPTIVGRGKQHTASWLQVVGFCLIVALLIRSIRAEKTTVSVSTRFLLIFGIFHISFVFVFDC